MICQGHLFYPSMCYWFFPLSFSWWWGFWGYKLLFINNWWLKWGLTAHSGTMPDLSLSLSIILQGDWPIFIN